MPELNHSWERMKNQPRGLNLIGCINDDCCAVMDWGDNESECPKVSKWAKEDKNDDKETHISI